MILQAGYGPKEFEQGLKDLLVQHVHCSCAQSSQKAEATRVSLTLITLWHGLILAEAKCFHMLNTLRV